MRLIAIGVQNAAAYLGDRVACRIVRARTLFFDPLEPMSDMEDGLLIGSPYRTKFSRLSCQIKLRRAMERMKVTVVLEN